MNIYPILYTILILLLGFFLKDIYTFVKQRFIRKAKPITKLSYKYMFESTLGTNPRMYTFVSKIVFRNIDTIPLYNIEIEQYNNKNVILSKSKECLYPEESFIIENKIVIPFGQNGNKPKEAEKKLPDYFKNPKIIVKYKNNFGHKYKCKNEKS